MALSWIHRIIIEVVTANVSVFPQLIKAPPPRCSSKRRRHHSIVQEARDNGTYGPTLRNAQSKNDMMNFFGIKRTKYSYICIMCIAHARQQARMQGHTAAGMYELFLQ